MLYTPPITHAPSRRPLGTIAVAALLALALAPLAPAARLPRRSIQTPESPSQRCLGCHDGTIARMVMTEREPWPTLGMHPVGVTYRPTFGPSSNLRDPSQPSGLGSSIAADLLVDGRVECTSCHAEHGPSGEGATLRISNQGSRLCLTCHLK